MRMKSKDLLSEFPLWRDVYNQSKFDIIFQYVNLQLIDEFPNLKNLFNDALLDGYTHEIISSYLSLNFGNYHISRYNETEWWDLFQIILYQFLFSWAFSFYPIMQLDEKDLVKYSLYQQSSKTLSRESEAMEQVVNSNDPFDLGSQTGSDYRELEAVQGNKFTALKNLMMRSLNLELQKKIKVFEPLISVQISLNWDGCELQANGLPWNGDDC